MQTNRLKQKYKCLGGGNLSTIIINDCLTMVFMTSEELFCFVVCSHDGQYSRDTVLVLLFILYYNVIDVDQYSTGYCAQQHLKDHSWKFYFHNCTQDNMISNTKYQKHALPTDFSHLLFCYWLYMQNSRIACYFIKHTKCVRVCRFVFPILTFKTRWPSPRRG